MAARYSKGMHDDPAHVRLEYRHFIRNIGHSIMSTTKTPILTLPYRFSPYTATMMIRQGYVCLTSGTVYATYIC